MNYAIFTRSEAVAYCRVMLYTYVACMVIVVTIFLVLWGLDHAARVNSIKVNV